MRDNPFPPSPRRSAPIDVARGLAIGLVIVGHSLEVLFYNRPDGAFAEDAFAMWRLIYAAHIPTFFFLAGMVSRPGGARSSPRAPRLLALALAFQVIAGVPLAALQVAHQGNLPGVVIALVRPFVLGTGFAAPSLWFLVALAGVEMLWERLARQWWAVAVAIVLLTVVSVGAPRAWPNIWCFRDLGPGLTFYAAGALIRRAPLRLFAYGAAATLVLWIWAAATNKGCYLPAAGWCGLPGLSGRFGAMMAIGAFGDYRLFLLSGLTGSLTILGMGVALSLTWFRRPLSWAGRRSLDLYLVNGLALAWVNPVLKSAPVGHDVVGAMIGTCIAMLAVQVGLADRLATVLDHIKTWSGRLADKAFPSHRARMTFGSP